MYALMRDADSVAIATSLKASRLNAEILVLSNKNTDLKVRNLGLVSCASSVFGQEILNS